MKSRAPSTPSQFLPSTPLRGAPSLLTRPPGPLRPVSPSVHPRDAANRARGRPATYRDGTGDGGHHDADGLRGQDGRTPVRKAGDPVVGEALGLLGRGLSRQRRLQLLLLLLLLDLALQLLLGVDGGGQRLHLRLERVALGRWDEGRPRREPLDSWKGKGRLGGSKGTAWAGAAGAAPHQPWPRAFRWGCRLGPGARFQGWAPGGPFGCPPERSSNPPCRVLAVRRPPPTPEQPPPSHPLALRPSPSELPWIWCQCSGS